MKSRVFIAFLVIFCSIQLYHASDNWFRNLIDPHISFWDSTQSGNKNLNSSNAIDNITGYIAAFGDINNDKYTDLFVVYSLYNSLDSDTIAIYEWSGEDLGYLEVENSILGDTYVMEVLAVIPSDYNYDGILDVLIHSCDNMTAELTIYFGDGKNSFGNPVVLSPKPSTQQVLLMDANMDMLPDVFGTDVDGNRVYWINWGNNTWTSQKQTSDIQLSPISSPHSNAFVDITGDCLSDLVVFNTDNGKTMELWVNGGTSYTFDSAFTLPTGAGQVSFADFDKDGTMDLIFPVCDPEPNCTTTNAIYVVYNTQTPMCTSITGSGTNCTSPSNICGNNGFSLPQMNITEANENVVIIPTSAFGGSRFLWKFILTPNSTVPETLRVGDFNMDGYPDIMFQVVSTDGVASAQLWQNVPCDDNACTENASNLGRRYFQNYVDGTDALTSLTNVYASTFMDIGEDGTLDMIVMRFSMEPKTPSRFVQSIQNSVDWGGFFFKVLGLNGLCTQWCDTEPKFPDPKPVGVNTPGVVFKYIYTNNDGDKEVAMGNQLTQSGYLALQTPYVYFGLGSVSNYIQTLYMGISITGGKRHYSSVADIIPNSQVAAYPSPPTSPRRWKFDISLRPSGMTFWTFVTCIVTCIILAILTIYFAWREKKEDKAERREKAHLFKL